MAALMMQSCFDRCGSGFEQFCANAVAEELQLNFDASMRAVARANKQMRADEYRKTSGIDRFVELRLLDSNLDTKRVQTDRPCTFPPCACSILKLLEYKIA